MSQITLKKYVKEHGQARVGVAFGVTQIAISKALRADQETFVVTSEEGVASVFGNKAFPSKW